MPLQTTTTGRRASSSRSAGHVQLAAAMHTAEPARRHHLDPDLTGNSFGRGNGGCAKSAVDQQIGQIARGALPLGASTSCRRATSLSPTLTRPSITATVAGMAP